jgi:ATP-dependent helicase Lhr and Lhr-like helicase
VIAAGEHVLATAPTGSGKTLTAFLWALNRFAAGISLPGHTRVLYVSPLKALNNDIRRNLLGPLAALEARGVVPNLRVETRSGDTPQGDRQRMLRRPPEILVTTPESLLLLLSGSRGRHALAGVETVIVDEVHALADNRRGTLLLVALWSALPSWPASFSASPCRPPCGRWTPSPPSSPDASAMDAATHSHPGRRRRQAHRARRALPGAVRGRGPAEKIWEPMAAEFRRIMPATGDPVLRQQPPPRRAADPGHQSRPAGARGLCPPRLPGARGAPRGGSAPEAGRAQGHRRHQLAGMGIDIGELDEVVLIQSPPGIGAALQRIGRAGHGVGEISRASLFPAFAQDFVSAAALAGAVATATSSR